MNDSITPNGITVLCAEDEHFISELYARALNKAGYTVTTIIDGEEALQAALTDRFDVILLDIMLPNKTGLVILDELRKDGTSKVRAKIIITTNLEQSEENRKAVEDQADGYVVKAEMTPRQLVEYLSQFNLESTVK